MTLCIGALAQIPVPLAPCIVLGFDYKVSNDYWGAESEYKFKVLSPSMVSLYAGAPGRARELALMYEDYLKRNPLELHRAADQLREPWAEYKLRLANAYVSRRFGFSYQKFLDRGPTGFGQDNYDRILKAIEAHVPNIQMIFAGFIGSDAVLFRLWEDIEICTNFTIIGAGEPTATPALFARAQTFTTSLSTALYNVYEAKRTGEASPTVGAKTRMYILRTAQEPQYRGRMVVEVVTPTGERWLQQLYKKHGPKPIKHWPLIPEKALRLTGHNLPY